MDVDQGKLFVGGISWETNEDKLKDHFSNYGDVLQAIVMRDKVTGRPRGFGFVLFADPSVLDRVLQEKHHIDTREVDVKRAMTREEQQVSGRSGNHNPSRNSGGSGYIRTKKIFVGGLPPTLTDDAFRQYFEAFGSVADVVIMYDQTTNRPRGFGFVSFDSEDAVDRVLHKTFHDLNGKQVEVKRALPRDAIPGGPGRSGGYHGGSGNNYEGRVESNRFIQPQNAGNGLPSYGSSGYGAGYGYSSNGVGYGAYGSYAGSTGGYGSPAGAAYGNPDAPGAGYGSGPGGAPRSSWGAQAPAGYGNMGYGNAAPSGYGGHGAAPSPGGSAGFSNQSYGYGGYSGSDSSFGNQPGFGAAGGRPSGGSNNIGGDLQVSGYGDGNWRSDPMQGYGSGYNGGQGRQG